MKEAIKFNLQTRADLSNLLDICSFLDPRFKITTPGETSVSSIREEMLLSIQDNPISLLEVDTLPPPPKKSWLGKILGTSTDTQSQTPEELIEDELQRYLSVTRQDVNLSPLEWWQEELPVLSRIEHQYLCICASSVPSERVFSTGGNIVSKSRNCLKPQSVDQLVFLLRIRLVLIVFCQYFIYIGIILVNNYYIA